MATQLTTGTSSGTQTTTQTPQAAGTPSGGAPANATGVQPGTASNLLNTTNGGVALKNTQVPLIGIGARQTGQVAQATPTPKPRDINPGLLVFSLLLFAAAAYMFWVTARSSKNTTE